MHYYLTCFESRAGSGNVFDWNLSDNYDVSNVTVTDEPLSSLCKADPLKNKFIVSERTSYDNFKSYCDKLNGIMPIPEDQHSLEEIHDQVYRE